MSRAIAAPRRNAAAIGKALSVALRKRPLDRGRGLLFGDLAFLQALRGDHAGTQQVLALARIQPFVRRGFGRLVVGLLDVGLQAHQRIAEFIALFVTLKELEVDHPLDLVAVYVLVEAEDDLLQAVGRHDLQIDRDGFECPRSRHERPFLSGVRAPVTSAGPDRAAAVHTTSGARESYFCGALHDSPTLVLWSSCGVLAFREIVIQL